MPSHFQSTTRPIIATMNAADIASSELFNFLELNPQTVQ